MRILCVAFADLDQTGVHRKLAEQATALRASGQDVRSLVFADVHGVLPNHTALEIVQVPGGGMTDASRASAFAHCRDVIAACAPDVVYLRYPVYDQHVLEFVRHAPPVVVELQTIYRNEAPSRAAAHEARWAAQVLPNAAGLVAVTSEILQDETSRAGWAIPGLVMPNGADPATIPFTTATLSADRVDVLCVASFYPWHGIDRLLVGFAAEPDVRDVHLHLIGDGPTLPLLRELAREAALDDRVHFHGPSPVHALDAWYARAHVAVGSLAPHRVGLRELAALKHREYTLRGVPFVLAGRDADFPTSLPWLRHLAADDTGVSPRMLRALGMAWTAPQRRRHIRQWGESHLSWDTKMPALVHFLEHCVSQRSAIA